MKNVTGLPYRWAVDIKAESEHPRMGEFKEWMCKTLNLNFKFGGTFYDPRICDNAKDLFDKHCDHTLPEGVTLITLDQFFEALDDITAPVITDAGKEANITKGLEAKGNGKVLFRSQDGSTAIGYGQVKPDWQPKRGEMVEVSHDDIFWQTTPKEFYGIYEGLYLVWNYNRRFIHSFKYIRPIEQPTQLVLEDAKEAYVRFLGLEGKKVEWV